MISFSCGCSTGFFLIFQQPTQHLWLSNKLVTFNIPRMILDSYPCPNCKPAPLSDLLISMDGSTGWLWALIKILGVSLDCPLLFPVFNLSANTDRSTFKVNSYSNHFSSSLCDLCGWVTIICPINYHKSLLTFLPVMYSSSSGQYGHVYNSCHLFAQNLPTDQNKIQTYFNDL